MGNVSIVPASERKHVERVADDILPDGATWWVFPFSQTLHAQFWSRVLNVQLDLAELRNLQTLSFIVYDRIIDDSHMRKILYSIPHTLENIRLVFHRTNPLSVFQSQDDSFLPLPSLTPAQLPSLSKFEICVPQLHADMIQPIEALWPEWRDREVLIVRLVTDEDDSHS